MVADSNPTLYLSEKENFQDVYHCTDIGATSAEMVLVVAGLTYPLISDE